MTRLTRIGYLAPLCILAAAASAVPTTGPAGAADDGFYKGKTMTMLIPTAPGGSYDFYARVLARQLPKHIPGAPTFVVQNMPGAGGKRLSNHLYRVAPKDGTVIGSMNQTVGLDQIFSGGDVEYNTAKFNWLGRVAPTTGLVMVYHTAPAKSLEEMKSREVIFAGQGKPSQTYMIPTLMRTLLDYKTRVVLGYTGSGEIYLAMEQGEVHGRTGSIETILATHPDWVDTGKIKMFAELSLEKEPSFPGVPLLRDLAPNDQAREILDLIGSYTAFGFSYAAPPDLPKERVAILRDAFAAVTKDSEFLAEMEKGKMNVLPESGETLQKLSATFADVSPDLVERTRKALEW